MVTDKVTKEVKDMVGEYNEWLRDNFFFKPKITQLTHLFSFASFLEITNKCDQCDYEYSHLCLLRTH